MACDYEFKGSSLSDISKIVSHIRQGYQRRLSWSETQQKHHALSQLKAFKRLMVENKTEIFQAVKADFNKCEEETETFEFLVVLRDLNVAIRDFDLWTAHRPVYNGIAHMMATSYLKPEPYGVALIIGAWNYPFQLIAYPFIGAIAAGNAVILKPSEISVYTSNLFVDLIPKYMDQDHFAVISGGADISQKLLTEKFDYIFYTGSSRVGRLVMQAAAQHLTPVTLEMGGKSPVIIADDANIEIAAERVMWTKLICCGQMCLSPDYVLCTSATRDRFVDACKKAITELYGEDVFKSSQYCKIVNKQHFNRLSKLMDTTQGHNLLSGQRMTEERFIAPAIYIDVPRNDVLMKEEIFGPLLPILTVSNVEEAIQLVNTGEHPLTCYVFTSSTKLFDYIASHTTSGSIVHNHTMMYGAADNLPFGGVGQSGMGVYHGKHSFDTFSHLKPVYCASNRFNLLNKMAYPPFSSFKLKIARVAFLFLSSLQWRRPLFVVMSVIAFAIVLKVLFK